MTAKPPTEPSADLRQIASHLYQMYAALIQEGFTEGQALAIIGHTIRGSFGGGS